MRSIGRWHCGWPRVTRNCPELPSPTLPMENLSEKGVVRVSWPVLEFYTARKISATANAKWAWSGSRKQFLHCGLKKFRHSKSSVYRWYTQLDRGRFVYDTYRTMEATRSRHGWVHMFISHCPIVTLHLHNFDLFRTCRTSSFCTTAWQLTRFQLTRRVARSLGDSWASCLCIHVAVRICSRSSYLLGFIDIFA